MFQKVLIAEDYSMINKGIEKHLKASDVPVVTVVEYCDKAFQEIQFALSQNTPYQLLITDLSFEEGLLNQKLTSGEELVAAVKKIQPELKIIVFTMEQRIGKIKQLVEVLQVDGFILKGRKDTYQIKKAIDAVYQNKNYFSDTVMRLLRSGDTVEDLDEEDHLILQFLAEGITQKEIPEQLEKNNFPTYQLRTIESRISKLKLLFDAKNIPNLMIKAKDDGWI